MPSDHSAKISYARENQIASVYSNIVEVTIAEAVDAETPKITVQPDGGMLSYEWYRNTIDSNTGGTLVATTPECTPQTDEVGTFYYYVVVTNTNNNVNGEKTASSVSRTIKVRVVPDELKVRISPRSVTMRVGEKVQLSATVSPSDEQVIWHIATYNGTRYAEVDQAGLLTAKENGTVIVRATIPANTAAGIVYDEITVNIIKADNTEIPVDPNAPRRTYTVTASSSVGGNISPSGETQVQEYGSITYSMTALEGYRLAWLVVDGSFVDPRDTYTFSNVTSNHEIKAVFDKEPTASEEENSEPEKDEPEPVKEEPEPVKEDPAPQDSKPDDEAELWTNPYSDVRESDDYYTAVQTVSQMGIMIGVSEDSFAPENELTRAMFVTILGRLSEIDAEAYSESNFTDVAPDAWYLPYVEWASSNGLVYIVLNQPVCGFLHHANFR